MPLRFRAGSLLLFVIDYNAALWLRFFFVFAARKSPMEDYEHSEVYNLRQRVGTRAIAWFDSQLITWSPSYDRDEPNELSQTALAEIALLVLTLQRRCTRQFDRHPSLKLWLDYLFKSYSRPGFHQYIFHGHRLAFIGHLIIWLTLSRNHYRLPVSREQIQRLVAGGDRTSIVARPLYRVMELRYFLDIGRFRHDLPSWGSLFRTGSSFAFLDLPGVEPLDIYAVTHTIFYLTDFGRHIPRFIPPDTLSRLNNSLQDLIIRMIHQHHWDLLAELLLAVHCISSNLTQVLGAGWRELAQAQDKSGAINEGPSASASYFGSELGEGFLPLYHRSLTAAMAAFLGRSRTLPV